MKDRKLNYKRLSDVGYNSKEATRFKDLKNAKMEKLIVARKVFNKTVENIVKER